MSSTSDQILFEILELLRELAEEWRAANPSDPAVEAED
jgi:hypothetical protein